MVSCLYCVSVKLQKICTHQNDQSKCSPTYIYMHKKNALNLHFRQRQSVESPHKKDNAMWQSHLFRQFDAVIGMKRIRWYQPKIPEHPSVLISYHTAENKACQTKWIRYVNAPEIYMEPSEYMLVPYRNYKRVATWSYTTDLKHNEKYTQTVINGLNLDVKYRTQPNSEMSSSLLLFTSQLDDSVEDDGPKPGSTAMDCTGTSGGLSLSFRNESMRMERLLGSICQTFAVMTIGLQCVHLGCDQVIYDSLYQGQLY